jgi:hypothetical protein
MVENSVKIVFTEKIMKWNEDMPPHNVRTGTINVNINPNEPKRRRFIKNLGRL